MGKNAKKNLVFLCFLIFVVVAGYMMGKDRAERNNRNDLAITLPIK